MLFAGPGKTEITYKTITYALSLGKQVGFAIPRKDVVIELEDRIRDAFPNNKIVTVYGGHTKELNAEIIILTTHQLYRYINYFDLLIIDETDAFPFSGNETLMNIFEKSIRGNYLMMSATPLPWMENKIKKEKGTYLTLMKRYHGHPLVVPQVKIFPYFQQIIVIKKLKEYMDKNYPVFVFCPTIDECEKLYFIVKMFIKNGSYVHSKCENRNEIISQFKKGKISYLITTSVLERGVTVKNIQVIVCNADSSIYNSATLIQIAGRVGRKMDAYGGEVIFIASKINESIETAIYKIKEANTYVDV